MERKRIKMELLAQNIGQVSGLPSNPRQWTRQDLDKLKESIVETPELLEARGILVYPQDEEYIILGGNMRYAAIKELGWKEAPCIVVPEGMDPGKLQEFVIKDNGSFGEWDWDALMAQWPEAKLGKWIGSQFHYGNEAQEEPEESQAREEYPEGIEVVTEAPQFNQDDLPEELQGIDIEPGSLEDYEGDDEVARNRIIITYDEDSRWKLENLFGVIDITSKVLWRLEDIMEKRNV